MKKLILIAASLASMFLAGSCQRENLEPAPTGKSVTFNVEAPAAMQTKAIADGLNVNELIYEVYLTENKDERDLTNAVKLYQGKTTMSVVDDRYVGKINTAKVEVELLQDQHYTVLFWAQVANTGAYNTENLTNVTYKESYGENNPYYKANDESLAAFYAVEYITDGDPAVKDVTLRRPFAQLNLGTTNAKATADPEIPTYTIALDKSKVKVEGVPTAFNVATSEVSVPTTMYFKMSDVPAKSGESDKTLTVNDKPYEYAGMNYLFAGNNVTVTYDIQTVLTAQDNSTKTATVNNTVTNVPLKENYRTNIIGNLLTSQTDYEVVVDADFNEGDYYGPEFVKEPKYNAETKTYTVVEALELKWVAQQVNTGKKSFKGETVQLAADIDLENEPWTPIGYNKKHFQGTFEGVSLTKAGNDYPTISNLYIENGEYAGLFGTISDGGLLRNFNLNHVRISGSDYLGAVLGQIYTTVDNVTVTDVEITAVPYLLSDGVTYDGGAKVGGIAGLVGQSATITNCTVSNATFKAYRDMGGIVGTTQNNYPTILTGNSVDNLTFIVTGFYTPYNGNDKPGHYHPIRGGKRSNAGDVIENNAGDSIDAHTVINEVGNGVINNETTPEVFEVSSKEGLEWVFENYEEIIDNLGDSAEEGIEITLSDDIDLAGLMTRSAINSNWKPLGTEEKPFTGTFNGNGKTIKNLTIIEEEAKEGKAYIGFFGYAKNATIKDVTFENVNLNIACLDIDHSQGHIGAVAGSLEGKSTIENVTVKGDIFVESTVTANGASRVAVVAGGNSYGDVTMKNVHVIANEGSYLKANNNVGALAGQLQGKSVFEDCSSNIDVTGTKFFAGGIIGLAAGDQTFTNCHTTGNVTITAGRSGKAHDHYRVGGIAGGWADGAKNVCTLTNCSYTGALSGTNADGSVADVFDYAGYVGRGYTLNGCKGSKVVIDGVEYVQAYNTAADAGLYIVDGDYAIASAANLKVFANKVNAGEDYFEGKTIKLANDIDLNNIEWTPIGSAYKDHGFMGNFDGNGKTIKNLKITALTPDADNYVYAGLFGVTEGTETQENYIKNLVIENVTIETTGHIAAAAIAYPYYTTVENITVRGNINIKGGDYTSGALAYTRRCVNAKDITVAGNEGSLIEGNSTVGGVISDIQMNGGLTAKYSNFSALGLTIKGTKCVGGISGIISNQTLDGATVKNVTLVCNDNRTGIVAGADGGKSTLENVSYENVKGATRVIGATYDGGYYFGQILEIEGVKAVVYSIEDGVKAVSVEELNLKGQKWQNAMDWAAGLGEGWALASMEDLNAIYDARVELNVALKNENVANALFWEGDELYIKNGSVYYALYMSSTEVPAGEADANGNDYFENRVFFKIFNDLGYSDVLYSAFDCINKSAPLRDNYFARATYTL